MRRSRLIFAISAEARASPVWSSAVLMVRRRISKHRAVHAEGIVSTRFIRCLDDLVSAVVWICDLAAFPPPALWLGATARPSAHWIALAINGPHGPRRLKEECNVGQAKNRRDRGALLDS